LSYSTEMTAPIATRLPTVAAGEGRDELGAGLMVDALDQAADSGGREAALVHFVERVGADEAAALRRALAELEAKHLLPGGSPDTS
jgi:predicted transcriptional regulator